MQVQALRLLVFFVPAEVEPLQSFEDGIHRGLGIAFDVGVVEAEDHGAAVVAGIEPVENKRAGAADVKKAGRAKARTERGAGRVPGCWIWDSFVSLILLESLRCYGRWKSSVKRMRREQALRIHGSQCKLPRGHVP